MQPGFAPTLVLVGDDVSFRYLIQRYATKSACQVVSVPLESDVTTAVRQAAPGIVLVELDFLDERARAVLRALKAHPDTSEIPVIVCSWPQEAEWSLDEGAAIHMQKPVLYDDFRAALINVGAWPQP